MTHVTVKAQMQAALKIERLDEYGCMVALAANDDGTADLLQRPLGRNGEPAGTWTPVEEPGPDEEREQAALEAALKALGIDPFTPSCNRIVARIEFTVHMDKVVGNDPAEAARCLIIDNTTLDMYTILNDEDIKIVGAKVVDAEHLEGSS